MLSKPQFDGECELVKLSEIAKIKAGNVAPKKDAFAEDGIPFVRAGSLTNLLAGESLTDLEKIDDDTAQKLRLTLFPAGTVVFAKSGMSCMTGNVYVLPKPCYVVSHLACVIPNGNYASYLKHYFRFNRPNRLIENPSFPSIKLSKIQGIELRLPSLEESVMQVQVLERIESQIEQAKALLTHLDFFVKSRFVEMFGDICEGTSRYDMVPINDLCICIVGGGTPSTKHPEYYENGTIPWLKSGDVKTHIVESGVLNITEVGLAKSSARMVPEGSIIVVTRSGILKHSLPIAKTARSIAINQDLKALIPGDHILPDYLQWSLIVASPLLLSKVRATTADNIETSFLKSFRVPFPPMFLQRKFVKLVNQVDKSRFISISRYRDILIKNGYRHPHLQGFNR